MHSDGSHWPSLAETRLRSIPNAMISNGDLEEIDVQRPAQTGLLEATNSIREGAMMYKSSRISQQIKGLRKADEDETHTPTFAIKA
jgi:hypothetical protein